jgi:hypothetical protein
MDVDKITSRSPPTSGMDVNEVASNFLFRLYNNAYNSLWYVDTI